MSVNESYKAALKTISLKKMFAQERSFDKAVYDLSNIPFDPKFNAVNWMFDCFQLAREIVYSYCWMVACAHKVPNQQKTEEEFRLQYYADNCITRISSFRDKAALCAWAYYCPFNPDNREEVLGFIKVLERLKHPVRFGLVLKYQKSFVTQLEKLKGRHFERIQAYRHCKIHRVEPKILLRLPGSSDGLSYMVPLVREEQINKFNAKLKAKYPYDKLRKIVEDSCRIKGVLFHRINAKAEHWHYPEVEEAARKCTQICVDVAKELSAILMRRAPLKQRQRK